MRREKYHYNPHTLRYEKVNRSVPEILLRVFGFLSVAFLFSVMIVALAYTFFESPKEKELKRELSQMEFKYKMLNKKMDRMDEVLAGLEKRDDNIYRAIFEAEPIPETIRQVGVGGNEQYEDLQNHDNSELMINTSKRLDKLSKQLYIQSKSYDKIHKMINNKKEMLASIPAIQPVSNKNLSRLASGYGYRIDPIYKTSKMHSGLDFAAPRGTEIYATGDAEVVDVNRSHRGYGNYIILEHGFGYETMYAHLSAIKVKRGEQVNRGEVIGEMGNTGKSTGTHLHYEVHKDDKKVDPINYFFNDLTPEEYEKMRAIASRHGQSLD